MPCKVSSLMWRTEDWGEAEKNLGIGTSRQLGAHAEALSNSTMQINHLGSCCNADSASLGPWWGLRCCISNLRLRAVHAVAHSPHCEQVE